MKIHYDKLAGRFWIESKNHAFGIPVKQTRWRRKPRFRYVDPKEMERNRQSRDLSRIENVGGRDERLWIALGNSQCFDGFEHTKDRILSWISQDCTTEDRKSLLLSLIEIDADLIALGR